MSSLAHNPETTASSDTRHGVTRSYPHEARSVIAHARLGSAVFETVAAGKGPFKSTFDTYAVVLSTTPSLGPLELNGSPVNTSASSHRHHSLFCPGDTLCGSFAGDVVYDVLYFDPRWIKEVISIEADASGLKLPSFARISPTPMLLALWRRIHCGLNTTGTPNLDLVQTCMKLMVLQLAEPQPNRNKPMTFQKSNRQLTRALNYIDANLGNDLNLTQIAKTAGISTFHFCRVFRHATGMSVRQFVMERRLERARKRLSSTDQTICAIAHDCGFSSQSHLTTAFKNRFGTTPHAFRRGNNIEANARITAAVG